MRPVKRIDEFCDTLKELWRDRMPDWRFGQFMSNFLGWAWAKVQQDIFFIEDGEMLELLKNYFEPSKDDAEKP